MKTILIFIALSLSSPNEPAILAHRSFVTMEQCSKTVKELKAMQNPEGVKTIAYCILAKDLTE